MKGHGPYTRSLCGVWYPYTACTNMNQHVLYLKCSLQILSSATGKHYSPL